MQARLSKDLASGVLFVALGIFFAAYAYLTLPIGTPYRMGPGFFPLVVGLILAAFGVAIMLKSLPLRAEPCGPVPVRAVILIPLALAAFGVLIRPLGLVPSVFILCMIAAFASRKMTVLNALAISAAMTLACVVIFTFILNLALPLFGTVFAGF